MQYLHDMQEVEKRLEEEDQVLVFKHSTQCPISAAAHKEVEEFLVRNDAPYAAVRVIEERDVSDAIQELTGVTHESPQAIIMRGDDVAWTASHRDITAQALTQAWNSAKAS